MSNAADIVKAVGGAGNIQSLTHCATRLRFQLVDASKVDGTAVDKIPGVMGSVPQSGERFQVIIGGAVQTVFNEINALPEMNESKQLSDAELKAQARSGGVRGKSAFIDNAFEFLSDSFRPILGSLLGASLFITFMSLMATLGVIGNWASPDTELSASWQFMNLLWQSVFVFLPLMVAYNASKKVGADPWVGFAIMALLMLPGFSGLGAHKDAYEMNLFGSTVKMIDIFGVPLTLQNYSSQVFPPLIMALVLGALYKGLKKIIPANLQLIFVPFLAMLVMLPLTAFLIGPIGVYAGAGLAGLLQSINEFNAVIFAIAIPLAYPFMVPLGLHWPLNAIMLANISTYGYDFIQGPMGAWNFACFGATAGVLYLAWRDRDTTMRQTASGALAAGLLGGISEPSLYGIHLRYKRVYPRMLAGCFIGGLIMGLGGGVTINGFVFTSLITIPAFNNVPLYASGIAAAFFTAMLLIIFTDYRTPEQREEIRARVAAEEAAANGAEAPAAAAAPVAAKAEAPVAAAVPAAAAAPAAVATATAVAEVPADAASNWVAGLGGADNIASVDAVAETRVRVQVKDAALVDSDALAASGVQGVASLGGGIWHLVVGLNADAHAAELKAAAGL
ncbi:PTS transporter subunit EIIB [Dermabacteraceae bacterium P7006]